MPFCTENNLLKEMKWGMLEKRSREKNCERVKLPECGDLVKLKAK